MHVIFTTTTGSTYEVNDADKSWKRLTAGNDEYTTRTMEGEFITRSDVMVGKGFTMLGKGLVAGVRLISTPTVIEVVPVPVV